MGDNHPRKDRPILRAPKTESDFFRGETQLRRKMRESRGAGGIWVEGERGPERHRCSDVAGKERGGDEKWGGEGGKWTLRLYRAAGVSRGQGHGMRA